MIDPTPTEYIPAWAQAILAALFGAGGVKMLGVWLENRRLAKADFRETLLERIQSLEASNLELHERLQAQAERLGSLQSENDLLKRALQLKPEARRYVERNRPDKDDPQQ